MTLQELLGSSDPGAQLRVMQVTGDLKENYPLLAAHYSVPQPALHHPEICTGWHLELCLNAAKALGASPRAMLGVLLHDVGKTLTNSTHWPKHHGHEALGATFLEKTPVVQWGKGFVEAELSAEYLQFALQVAQYHLKVHTVFQMKSTSVAKFICALRQAAKPFIGDDDQKWFAWMYDLLVSCASDAKGRLGKEDTDYPQRDFLMACVTEPDMAPLWKSHLDQDESSSPEYYQAWSTLHTARATRIDQLRLTFLGDAQ